MASAIAATTLVGQSISRRDTVLVTAIRVGI